jgi:hypothetical protein
MFQSLEEEAKSADNDILVYSNNGNWYNNIFCQEQRKLLNDLLSNVTIKNDVNDNI